MAGKRNSKRARKLSQSARKIRLDAGISDSKNAVMLLKEDHREVEALFKEFKKAETAGKKRELAGKICAALKVHTAIEEQIFYSAFIAATGEDELHDEAQVEHAAAKKLIAEIEGSTPGDSLYDARVKVLSEMIKHHVREEERFGGMFSKARRSSMNLDLIGARLQARKIELMASPAKRAIGKARASRAAVVGAAAMNGKRAARTTARRAS